MLRKIRRPAATRRRCQNGQGYCSCQNCSTVLSSIQERKKSAAENRLRKTVGKPRRGFPTSFAVCCAHNLSPDRGQIPHLQPVKYVPPGTEGELPRTGKRGHPGVRPGGTYFLNYSSPSTGKKPHFFDSLLIFLIRSAEAEQKMYSRPRCSGPRSFPCGPEQCFGQWAVPGHSFHPGFWPCPPDRTV